MSITQGQLPLLRTAFYSNKQPVSDRKLRGGYYTPIELADYLANWALRTGKENILEPSCGDGNFVVAALQKLTALRKDSVPVNARLTTVEIEKLELEKAIARSTGYHGLKVDKKWLNADFFGCFSNLKKFEPFDVILGNPPFIRFQYFDEESRGIAFSHLRNAHYKPTKLANAWCAFVQLSIELLGEGGRLAMVLPAELLQVGYASELRNRLTRKFNHVTIIGFRKLVFPEIQQEVVLLLADGKQELSFDNCEIHTIEFENGDDLLNSDLDDAIAHAPSKHSRPGMKWTGLFLSNPAFAALDQIQRDLRLSSLGKLAEVDVGIVTGRNSFFLLSEEFSRKISAMDFVVPIVARTNRLKSISFKKQDFDEYKGKDPAFLLNLNNQPTQNLPAAIRNYIAQGEKENIHQGYKCRNRKRWFDVPSIYVPDAFLFRQIHKYPLLTINQANATSTDTIHRVRFRKGVQPEKLAAIFFNSLTLAWAEVCGRSYGGGVLELEPREAEHLPIPYSEDILIDTDRVDELLRQKRDGEALDYVDRVVLSEYLGIDSPTLKYVRNAWVELRERRGNRR